MGVEIFVRAVEKFSQEDIRGRREWGVGKIQN
jgi:hypothetical protein